MNCPTTEPVMARFEVPRGMAVHFSSKSHEWTTPQWLFDALDREFGFTLDPRATKENAKCDRYFTSEENGLEQDWTDEACFCNPPYGSQIGKWVSKAFESSLRGAVCVLLLPARTDTNWFHRYCLKGEIRFFKGRLKFGDGTNSAPFPSMIVVFRPPEFRMTGYDPKG